MNVLVLRHDTGRKVSALASELRWWSIDVTNVSYSASRGDRRSGDFPYMRREPDSRFCERVTILEGWPEPEDSRGGWGEEEARQVLARLQGEEQGRSNGCTCGVPTCPVCHYRGLIEDLRAEAKDREHRVKYLRGEYELAQTEGRDGWSEVLRAEEGMLANTMNRLKWAERDLREAREGRGA